MAKHIQPGEKVPLKLTASQQKLILNEVSYLDRRHESLLRDSVGGVTLMMTLDDYDDFGGCIAAEANHCEDRKLQKKLDTIFQKVQRVLDKYTDEVHGSDALSVSEARDKISRIMNAMMDGQPPVPMSFRLQPEALTQNGKIKLTSLQRETLIDHTELKPAIKRKLRKAEAGTQTLEFNRDELNEIHDQTGIAATYARSKEKQRLMAVQSKVVSIFEKDHAGLFEPPESRARKASGSIFQFRIRLENIEPTIWRRIQVQDCTLDELHEYIQGAMGWENYHLHQFTINGVEFGPVDPHAMPFGPEFEDESAVLLSDVLPRTDSPISFGYTYDFGDGWEHEIVFEGNPEAATNQKYPICLEGERACPPEDVGGPWGFAEYLEALADPANEQHADFLEWRGPFQAEKFSAKASTRAMQKPVRSGV